MEMVSSAAHSLLWFWGKTLVPNWLLAILATGSMLFAVAAIFVVCNYVFRSGVKRQFCLLSLVQQQHLTTWRAGGSRQFQVSHDTANQYWFEELENWRYVRRHTLPIYVLGAPLPCEITEHGWKEMNAKSKQR
ncbi:hypothetical protein [Reyranella massiliensis]|uniref:hypothetical protein n=1 Tax=Reyranella massiliensis TaxID=445220 RepID=UPI0011D28B7C|nr:hypothetical protein [Reyranella massiliensis]